MQAQPQIINTADFALTPKQQEANALLGSYARHILLRGGSRSGKTFLFIRAMIIRSIKCKSRHVILRKHFAHVKQSVWHDTLVSVFDKCFKPLKALCKFNQTDWFIEFPNGSQIWLGGLDDKERTDKILGKEYSTIFFNECSELDYTSVCTAYTRLAERNFLSKKVYYDCNPGSKQHWSYSLFVDLKNPETGKNVDKSAYASMVINPIDNQANIDPDYISGVLEQLPPALRKRFLDGEYGDESESIIKIDWLREREASKSDCIKMFLGIDPAISSADNADETAMTVGGMLWDNNDFVEIETISGKFSFAKQIELACKLHDKYNFEMCVVEGVAYQRVLIDELQKRGLPVWDINKYYKGFSQRNKAIKVISITHLFEQKRVYINTPKLQKQLLDFRGGTEKNDLVDSLVFCLLIYMWFRDNVYQKKIEYDKSLYKSTHDEIFWKAREEEENLKMMQKEFGTEVEFLEGY